MLALLFAAQADLLHGLSTSLPKTQIMFTGFNTNVNGRQHNILSYKYGAIRCLRLQQPPVPAQLLHQSYIINCSVSKLSNLRT